MFGNIFRQVLSHKLTHVITHCPGFIIVEVDVTLPVRPGKKGMCQNASGAIKGQVITMPVPMQ